MQIHTKLEKLVRGVGNHFSQLLIELFTNAPRTCMHKPSVLDFHFICLRSRLRIEVRPTGNDLARLYKNGDISVIITCN